MKKNLHDRLSQGQYVFGFCYLASQQLVIPLLLSLVFMLAKLTASNLLLNIVFFAVNFLVIVVVFHRYLWRELKAFFSRPLHSLGMVLACFLLYWFVNIYTSIQIGINFPNFSNANDANIQTMAGDDYWLMFIGSVLMVPIVEETLYRGVLFGFCDRFGRPLAYAVTCLMFAMIHVVGYIGTMEPIYLIVSLFQYIPAGLCLGLAYSEGGSIFVPILIHTAVNCIGMAAMR